MIRYVALIFLLACTSPVYPVSPRSTADSTFMVTVSYDGEDQWMGTAWIVANEDDKTQLVTAGHVCQDEPDAKFTVRNLTLMAQDGETFQAVERMHAEEPDLCLIEASGNIGRRLPLAQFMPEYGSAVAYVGAPLGIWGGGLAPLYKGYYAGGNLVSIAAAGGASGSALYTLDGVFGVLVRRTVRFESLTYIETLPDLKKFLDHAGL